MNLAGEIKEVLEYDDLEKIVEFLKQAEKKVDEKIAVLRYSKSKIQLAKSDYEKKLQERQNFSGTFIKDLPDRVIMLSDTLQTPTLDNLWNYLSHFYGKIAKPLREQFLFEDLAGIYTENGKSGLFAVCRRYTDIDGLKVLPKGKYLCANCIEENKEQMLSELINISRTTYAIEPRFTIQLIHVSGILQ